jgi:hypothetical protein
MGSRSQACCENPSIHQFIHHTLRIDRPFHSTTTAFSHNLKSSALTFLSRYHEKKQAVEIQPSIDCLTVLLLLYFQPVVDRIDRYYYL